MTSQASARDVFGHVTHLLTPPPYGAWADCVGTSLLLHLFRIQSKDGSDIQVSISLV